MGWTAQSAAATAGYSPRRRLARLCFSLTAARQRRILGEFDRLRGKRCRGQIQREAGELKFSYGGQAVIEGVMMRGAHSMAVAVRNPKGEIVIHEQPLSARLYRGRIAKTPFFAVLSACGTRWGSASAP